MLAVQAGSGFSSVVDNGSGTLAAHPASNGTPAPVYAVQGTGGLQPVLAGLHGVPAVFNLGTGPAPVVQPAPARTPAAQGNGTPAAAGQGTTRYAVQGVSAAAALRWLGANGVTPAPAGRALAACGYVGVSPHTVSTQIQLGRKNAREGKATPTLPATLQTALLSAAV